jgi:dTDP-4-amino-4,6-dideoxygalactose transaminase
VAARYDALLAQVPGIVIPRVAAEREHVYHLYVIRTDRRDPLRAHLKTAGIDTVINYPKALPLYPAYAYLGYRDTDFPVAYENQSRILSLPIYPEIGAERVARVAERVGEFMATVSA